MRSIDPELKSRIMKMQQTIYENANPSMEVTAIRPQTPIFHSRFWQETIVAADTTAICTSVAVRRTGNLADRVYVAYVDSTGLLTVKSAALAFPVSTMAWTIEETIAGCTACALEFDGTFVEVEQKVEFRTGTIPYLFYATSTTNELMGGLLGSASYINISGNVTGLDTIHGVVSKYGDMDQGIVLFYVSDGVALYREMVGDVWGDESVVDLAPANAVTIKAERTFDWRIVLHVQDNTGALYEVFGRSYVSGWSNTEELTARTTGISVNVFEINEQDSMAPDEYITAFTPEFLALVYKAESPVMYDASNYAVEVYDEETEEYSDNYGLWVNLRWDAMVLNEQSNLANIVLTDAYDTPFPAQEIIVDPDYPNRMRVRFNDFNNAENPCTITYTPGTLSSGVVDVLATSVQFTATGLVPTFIPAPEFVSAINSGNRKIIIEFDRAIIDIVSHGMVVTGQEPNMSPQGADSTATYIVDTVACADPPEYYVENFISGEMTNVELVFSELQLEVE